MDKKDLKFYEAPVVEAMGVELEGFLCLSDDDPNMNGGAENVGGEGMGDEE